MAEEENIENPVEAEERPKAEEPAVEEPKAEETKVEEPKPEEPEASETSQAAPEEEPEAEEIEPEAPRERGERDENTVYVGKKGVMGYVLAVVTQFNNGATDVTIKARGKLISRAVDVAEIVRNRFLPGVKVENIDIMTEELQSEDGSRSKVSAMEIRLKK